jgi:pimeloyl-ACP methyl ester carboxylesterase
MTVSQHGIAHNQLSHETAEVNGIRLHFARAGDGPLVVFLHGFPQCWYQFRHQLSEFSRDHLAVAPDLRGHNLSSKPEDVHAYLTCTLVEDVRQLVEHSGTSDSSSSDTTSAEQSRGHSPCTTPRC